MLDGLSVMTVIALFVIAAFMLLSIFGREASAVIETGIATTTGWGWGTCYRCHGSWEYLDGHVTRYNDERGCFPLCESCWESLGTPESRLPYYHMMWDDWVKLGYCNPLRWEEIEAAVRNGG